MLVLSLFPGIDLLGLAFEEAGFCVVRGPDLLWGGDVRGFHPPRGKFDGMIGGPPCLAHSRASGIMQSEALDLIPGLTGAGASRAFAVRLIGNGVPLALGRHIARAVLASMYEERAA